MYEVSQIQLFIDNNYLKIIVTDEKTVGKTVIQRQTNGFYPLTNCFFLLNYAFVFDVKLGQDVWSIVSTEIKNSLGNTRCQISTDLLSNGKVLDDQGTSFNTLSLIAFLTKNTGA